MNTVSADPQLAEPYLLGWLASLGLDVDYVRAEGNTLYYLGASGEEIPVLDFAGGYGSLILGHNHPRITAYAQQLLASQTPVHAQFSRHPYANDVALALNRILQRELGTEENYSAIFANTGAEAVEAAVKHAELDRGLRLAELRTRLEENLAAARAAVAMRQPASRPRPTASPVWTRGTRRPGSRHWPPPSPPATPSRPPGRPCS